MSGEICVVVGTRPGIIMMAPIIHELIKRKLPHYVLHTGQHYSPEMDAELFEDLGLTKAAFHFDNIAAAEGHGGKTARMLEGCESAFLQRRPELVIVNGDANTNLAAALAARKLGIRIAHSEAGERSYDWRMPEEHNRRMMDHISELLFATSEKSAETLRSESVQGEVSVVGNTIVDASLNHAKIAQASSDVLNRYCLDQRDYILLTSHREENVDHPERLLAIAEAAVLTAETLGIPVVFPIHPRTKKNLENFNLFEVLKNSQRVKLLPPVRYLDFIYLLVNAKVVVTDSGGVQQESHIHGIPCVTIRDNTEWTETLRHGANRLAGASDPEKIREAVIDACELVGREWAPVFGDGKTASRIIDKCELYLSKGTI